MAKVPQKQAELLAREEIARLFANCSHPVHRMVLQTMYAAGLRVSEACAVRVTDIDSHSDRMCIRVACGKGGHSRYSILSATLLANLRTYARTFRPRTWLFCNHTGALPVIRKATTTPGASAKGSSTDTTGWCMPRRHWAGQPRFWSI